VIFIQNLTLALVLLFVLNSSFASERSCRELDRGESISVDKSSAQSKSGVKQKYTIKKESEGVFTVYFKINFYKRSNLEIRGIDGNENTPSAINEVYRSRFQNCYDFKQKYLKDELGRRLRLMVYDEDRDVDIEIPPQLQVEISNIKRSNSKLINSEASCSTIVHETMHWMGLSDEYEEKNSILNPNLFARMFQHTLRPREEDEDPKYAYDCRSVGRSESIMVSGRSLYLSGDIRVLDSGHIDTIVYPNCTSKNRIYYQCVSNAYRTSTDHGGAGCAEVPDICKTREWTKR